MKRHRLNEIRLRNFRCFREQQIARMAPLTLLVGDNSTGKTSFLAAVRAIWETVFQRTEPDFRASPYDLGSFSAIVFNDDTKKDRVDFFEIGCSGLDGRRKFHADIAFEPRAAAPFPARISLKTRRARVMCSRNEREGAVIEVGTGNNLWRFGVDRQLLPVFQVGPLIMIRMLIQQLDELDIKVERVSGTMEQPGTRAIETISNMLHDFSFTGGESFASAPIRSSPHRTYDPIKPLPDPEGSYIPTYFANVNFQDKTQWNRLKGSLERFGRTSGLFHEIGVKQLGDMGEPFQLEIKVDGAGANGRRRNLIDVGYGVSQVLPVLTEVLRPDAPSMMLFQQPEVHLHPSAQAALGSLFCSAAASGRQFLVETHSDYIIDRILLDIRDKRTKLKPDDVSILYFERGDRDVTIHSIRIDAEGNVLDAPDGYRKFFKDELNRVIDY